MPKYIILMDGILLEPFFPFSPRLNYIRLLLSIKIEGNSLSFYMFVFFHLSSLADTFNKIPFSKKIVRDTLAAITRYYSMETILKNCGFIYMTMKQHVIDMKLLSESPLCASRTIPITPSGEGARLIIIFIWNKGILEL
ncbi:hypothetical protein ASG16_024260 [Brevibacillus sp. Leaf182]|nr:hypothetical protein ASG16_024260 [Brevibacillus sp. Leaf182]